jgi:hypothetical protein
LGGEKDAMRWKNTKKEEENENKTVEESKIEEYAGEYDYRGR